MFSEARRQLTVIYAASGVLLFALLAIGIFVTVVALLDREIDADIEHVLEESGDLVTIDPEGDELDVPTAFGPVFLFAFSPEGFVTRNPRDLPAYQVVPSQPVRLAAAAQEEARLTRTVDGERFRLHLQPVVQDGETVAVLVAGRSLARRDSEVRLVSTTLAGGGVVWAVLASVAAYLIAGRALRPMRQAYARQEAFVAGAAHELRSPIGVIRAASEIGLRREVAPETRELLTEINAVASDASSLVDTLLDLARMRAEDTDGDATSDLAQVVGRELSRMEPLLREHEVRVVDDLGGAVVTAPATAIGRITRALLENVIAHTPRGTSVIVRTWQSGGFGVLSVEDSGPGVPADALESIFEPFSRGDEARRRGQRVGMGLSIVRTVAEHHGGRVEARIPPSGQGLLVEVALPIA